jgi:hypothetical protein
LPTRPQGIDRIEYCEDRVSWSAITGPLTVTQGSLLFFRAVKKDPDAAWPEGEPVWTTDAGLGSAHVTPEGVIQRVDEDIDVLFLDATPATQTVRAACGGDVAEVTVNVLPKYNLTLSVPDHPVLTGGVGRLANAQITAAVLDPYENPVPGVAVHFALTPGSIGTLAPGTARTVVTDPDGRAYATYISGDRDGSARLTVTATAPDGDPMERKSLLLCDSAYVEEVDVDEWERMPDGRYRARVSVRATFRHEPLADRFLRFAGEITNLRDGDNPPGFERVLSFDPASGTTDGAGELSTYAFWDTAATPTGDATPEQYGTLLDAVDPLGDKELLFLWFGEEDPLPGGEETPPRLTRGSRRPSRKGSRPMPPRRTDLFNFALRVAGELDALAEERARRNAPPESAYGFRVNDGSGTYVCSTPHPQYPIPLVLLCEGEAGARAEAEWLAEWFPGGVSVVLLELRGLRYLGAFLRKEGSTAYRMILLVDDDEKARLAGTGARYRW